ncbi:MAG: TetR/AcrR family transcriptional regulator [Caulobacteraceae bacterium]|nr:MAG: TetR/AcrR family transcriptional regulator [Caulobacteraceae bacterium]
MPKASRQSSALRREQLVLSMAAKVRRRGLGGVSVPDLMAEAGMTHGGFYKHFSSKEALEAEACVRALEEMAEREWSLIDADAQTARSALFDFYLSPGHRDGVGEGCAIAALAPDAARRPDHDAARVLAAGIERQAEVLAEFCGDRDEALAALSTLVGAIVLARATDGALSDDILAAARQSLEVTPT